MDENTTPPPADLLLDVALDLTASLSADDRYARLIAAVRRVLPCDSAVLLRLEGDALSPTAAHGLQPEALGRRYLRKEHPRLDILCEADGPRVFPPDSNLPDPFDGLIAADPNARHRVHACLGCPLRVDGVLVGVLAADALRPDAFDHVDLRTIRWLGALAGAAMRTSALIEALERDARRHEGLARDLMRDAEQRRGGQLLGRAPVLVRLREEVELVGRSSLAVLVTGETGTGKELVARALHAASPRSRKALIYVNCAALPEAVAESELFGHVRGAFTGAERDRPGKFEVADGGTIFLDEVGELPASVQPKLLRALQEGEIQRVGSDRALRVDVRVVAATNRDLEAEVAAGRFRLDLFHRLNVYRLRVPALRERLEDVPLLAGWFGDEAGRGLGVGPVRLSGDARAALERFPWPGNVRELENVMSRAVLRASAGATRGEHVVVEVRHLGPEFEAPAHEPAPAAPSAAAGGSRTLREAAEEFQRDRIRAALRDAGGSWAAAARALGMDRGNLHHLAKRLGLR